MSNAFEGGGWPPDPFESEPLGSDPLDLGGSGLLDNPLSSWGLENPLGKLGNGLFSPDPWGQGNDLLRADALLQGGSQGVGYLGVESPFAEPFDDLVPDVAGFGPEGLASLEPSSQGGLTGRESGALEGPVPMGSPGLPDGHAPVERSAGLEQYDELSEEFAFIQKHEIWKEDGPLNEMLGELEESIEGAEERPYYPRWPEDNAHDRPAQRNARPIPPLSAGPPHPDASSTRRSRRAARAQMPPESWRPRGRPGMPRSRKATLRTNTAKSRRGRSFIYCPLVRHDIDADECRDCEHQNIERWLENPGKEDRCTHPDYHAYLMEQILGPESSEGED